MKKKLKILIVIFLISPIFLSSILVNSLPAYDNSYKFIEIYEQWAKIDGYDQISISREEAVEFKILDFGEDWITFMEISDFISIVKWDLTFLHNWYYAPVGFYFLKPDFFDTYYTYWETESNIYSVLMGCWVGNNISSDVRTAENYTFEGEFSGIWSGEIIQIEWNETEEDYELVRDEQIFNSSIIVTYDSNGVLLDLECELSYSGDIAEGETNSYIRRVDEFNQVSFNILPVLALMIFSTATIRSISKTKKE